MQRFCIAQTTMSLRFEKLCYPDVLDYKARKEKGLFPLPRKPNVWSTAKTLSRSGSDILGTSKKNAFTSIGLSNIGGTSGRETFRGSTSFTRGWKRQGYRKDLEQTRDSKSDTHFCVFSNKVSRSMETDCALFWLFVGLSLLLLSSLLLLLSLLLCVFHFIFFQLLTISIGFPFHSFIFHSIRFDLEEKSQ